MAAKIDIKANSRITYDKSGYRVERVALVSGVTGNVEDLLQNAIDDAALPNYGDAHPTITDIKLQTINAVPTGGGNYRVILSYFDAPGQDSGATNATVRTSAATSAEETKYDIDGEPMYTHYGTAGAVFVSYDPFTAEVERPRITFDLDYVDTIYPQALIDTYAGRVNAVAWNGYAPKTILCVGVTADEQATDFRVRFSFAYNRDTWQFVGRVSNLDFPLTDYPVLTPDTALNYYTGERPFDVYDSIDFNTLGFDLGGIYAEMSGTVVTAANTETNIVIGGKTILLTLTRDTWAASGAAFDAERQNIIDGLTSNKSETNGFDSLTIPLTDVVRTSDTVVTITLTAQASYNITQPEKIDCVIPESALVASAVPLTVSQRFDIDPV